MSTARLLVILGSGETAPSMTATHRAVFARLGVAPDAWLLDTPYGFQENAEGISRRILHYFRDQVSTEVRLLSLRRTETAGDVAIEQALTALGRGDWVFAGPGSPSYMVRQLAGTLVVEALRAMLRRGGALVFASAAACTLGRLAVPVYEVYKVGQDPHWIEGLDLVAEAGLDAVVLPHFDNAEGGTHDTRFCYLGERRLQEMEAELPDDLWVLGVDERTAAVIDLAADTVVVHGRGGLTVRRRGGSTWFPPGTDVPLDRLREAAGVPGSAGRRPAVVSPEPGADDEFELVERFAAALRAGDALSAAGVALDLEQRIAAWPRDEGTADLTRARRLLRSMLVDLATTAQGGLHDHRLLVAPLVDALLELRGAARERGDFSLSDALRERLAAAGVHVRDTPDGPIWTYHDPPGTDA